MRWLLLFAGFDFFCLTNLRWRVLFFVSNTSSSRKFRQHPGSTKAERRFWLWGKNMRTSCVYRQRQKIKMSFIRWAGHAYRTNTARALNGNRLLILVRGARKQLRRIGTAKTVFWSATLIEKLPFFSFFVCWSWLNCGEQYRYCSDHSMTCEWLLHTAILLSLYNQS